MSILLAAAAAIAPIECDPLPGWERVADYADGKYLIFGETHGTQEAPHAVGEYVCAVSEQRSILVAIEFNSTSNDGFQRAWAKPHDEFRQALRDEVPEWRGREDGVASMAMFNMLVRLHALKSAGRNIAIVAFNGAKDDAQRAKFAHLPGQEPHEAAQAENIRAGWQAGAYHQTVVLVGRLHAEKAPVELGRSMIRPMANQIAAAEYTVSLDMVHSGGASWSCQLDPDADFDPTQPITEDMIVCAEHAAGASNEQQPLGFSLGHSSQPNAFDGGFSLGPITASPPAVPKKD